MLQYFRMFCVAAALLSYGAHAGAHVVILFIDTSGRAHVRGVESARVVPPDERCTAPAIATHFGIEFTSRHGPCVLPLGDPRAFMFDDHSHHAATRGGYMEEGADAVFTLPDGVDTFVFFDTKDRAKRQTFSLKRRVALQETLDSTGLAVSTVQLPGPPSHQPNIVFLSSGYTSAQQSLFESDVASLVSVLQGGGSVSAMPYSRYFSMINIFRVFLPSQQEGASKPAPAGDGTSVNDVLQCSYGVVSSSRISCNRALVLIAASYAPVTVSTALVVVVINDNIEAAAAASNVAFVTNTAQMVNAFMHQIGHAQAGLGDEFSYGSSESRVVSFPNCNYRNFNTPWQDFVNLLIIPQPITPCTYNNYYRPTNSCRMNDITTTSYCEVCTYFTLQSMYDRGLSLASPRFPRQFETAFVEVGTGTLLYVNPAVVTTKDATGGFVVEWTVTGPGVSELLVAVDTATFGFGMMFNGTGFTSPSVGSYTVTATIKDSTTIMIGAYRQASEQRNGFNATALYQKHTFSVEVVSSTDPQLSTCTTRTTPSSTTYCSTCQSGFSSFCENSFNATPSTELNTFTFTFASFQMSLIAIVVGGGVGGLVLMLILWRVMVVHVNNTPVEILPLTTPILVVRGVLMFLAILLLLASVATITASVYVYVTLVVFGRAVVLGIISCAVVTWVLSFAVFASAFYKSRWALFAAFVVSLLMFVCVFLFMVLILYVFVNVGSSQVQTQLRAEWTRAITFNPGAACNVQGGLRCSGFSESCDVVTDLSGSSNCPANCEEGNLYTDPCFYRVQSFIKQYFQPSVGVSIALTIVLLVVVVLSIWLGWLIKMRRNAVHRERRVRYATGQNILKPEELAMLRREFLKVDRDGSGDLSRAEFAYFYNAVMGAELSPRELEEYFDKLDADGNGVLSFEEFVRVYVPHREPKRRNVYEKPDLPDAKGTPPSTDSEFDEAIKPAAAGAGASFVDLPSQPSQVSQSQGDGFGTSFAMSQSQGGFREFSEAGDGDEAPYPDSTERPQTTSTRGGDPRGASYVDHDLLFDDSNAMSRMDVGNLEDMDLDIDLEEEEE